MNQVFHDCMDEFVIVYIDDLLIFGKEKGSNYPHLSIIPWQLQNMIRIRLQGKFSFSKTKFTFCECPLAKKV